MKKTTVLMILDGYGITDNEDYNGVFLAKTPNIDKLVSKYPNTLGEASGLAVGLPRGQMGNSEVGHTNIGAGRVVYQELTRISKAIEDGDFFKNDVLKNAMMTCQSDSQDLHLCGLLSDGGVHSHNEHLYALLKMAKDSGLEKVYIHVFLDGRDTAPTSSIGYLKELQEKIDEIGVGRIATITGRYYALDRDNRWERVRQAYYAMVLGQGIIATDPIEIVERYHAGDLEGEKVTDEFVPPTVISDEKDSEKEPVGKIKENDTVIFFNFRPDRARELTSAFCNEDFDGFERPQGYFPTNFLTFTDYDVNITNKTVVFEKDNLQNTLGEHISNLGLTQLRMAETEKYPHVTFFFNGGREEPFVGEDRILVPSPMIPTYDLKPEMSAPELTKKLLTAIESAKYDLIVINYANPDMVGHTGDLRAVIEAIETVDEGVGQAYDAVMKIGGQMFICADHGNADKMIDYETREPHTAHTTNLVPFILVNNPNVKELKIGGKLGDIAPTVLDMMGLEPSSSMTGNSLILK